MEIKGLKKNMFRECLRVFHEPVYLRSVYPWPFGAGKKRG
jgi:hypothetical protein